jgi:hypothetical protein
MWGSGGIRVASPFLTSTLDGDEWSVSRCGSFTAEEIAPSTHWIGGWVGFKSGLDAMEKRRMLPCRGSKPYRSARVLLLYRLSYPDSSPQLGLGLPPWNSPFHFGFFLDPTQSVGLLGRVISSSQGLWLYTNTEKRTYTNTKHPCPEWDSNPRSRVPSERRQYTL